jgi:hypothetical protein
MAQIQTKDLRIFVIDQENNYANAAEVTVNGNVIEFDSITNGCFFLKDFKADSAEIIIKYKDYEILKITRGIYIGINNIFGYLGYPGDRVLISGENRIPFKSDAHYIGVIVKQGVKNQEKLEKKYKKLIEELKIVECINDSALVQVKKIADQSFKIYKKIDGSIFSEIDCIELEKIRNCEYVSASGPILNDTWILTNEIFIRLKVFQKEKNVAFLKKYILTDQKRENILGEYWTLAH